MFFITFKIGSNNYALPMEQVSEVLSMVEITKISIHAPAYFLGLISVREETLSVIDLRIKMSQPAEITDETGIIVCKTKNCKFGIVVDYIYDVADISESELKPPPIVPGQSLDMIKNVVRRNQKLTFVVDINSLFTSEEISSLKAA